MDIESLVENSLSRLGLRTLHVIRYGAAVDVDQWLGEVPGEAAGTVKVVRTCEEELGIHHAYIHWNAREMVEFQGAPVRYGVLWYIAHGERMRDAIEFASCLYRTLTGVYPRTIWAEKVPEGAPEVFELEGFEKDRGSLLPAQVSLKEGWWVPQRYILAGIESKERELRFDEKEMKYVVK
jgi:hypothetical protein